MIAGQRGALHKHTLCYLNYKGNANERCTIVDFDRASDVWRVRLVDPKWQGKELKVKEPDLRVGFCLMPSALDKERVFVKCESEAGACGRSLVVRQHVKCDTPIFTEPPFIVAGSRMGDAEAMLDMCLQRWHAYVALASNANKEKSGDGKFTRAVAAFGNLCIGSCQPAEVRAGAEHITAKHFEAATTPPTCEARAEYFDRVFGVLGRFQSNQFRLDTLHDEPSLASSGLCAPSRNICHSAVGHPTAPACTKASSLLSCSSRELRILSPPPH